MIKKFLNLGKQPLANNYLTKNDLKRKKKQIFYTLEVGFNTSNKLVSITNTVSSKKMFANDYPYRSSMSKTIITSFKKLAKKILNQYHPNLILEIGSNDGSFIKNFNKKKSICVEPCGDVAKTTKKLGYQTYSDFWNLKLARKIKKKNKNVDLVYSANTLSHILDLKSVFKSISYILSKNGILIIEDPSLLECLKKTSYDQFYNEHIYVFSLCGIKNFIKKFGFEVFKIETLSIHGGSLRFYIKRIKNKEIKINNSVKIQLKKELKFGLHKFSTYIKYKKKVEKSKKELQRIFRMIKNQNNKIIGYGATAKSVTVLNYCGIKNDTIDYFMDTTPGKIGKYMPGTYIYIKGYKKTLIKKNKYCYLGAWNFKNEIFKKEKNFIKNGGKFITHVPFPRIIKN